MTWHSFQRGCRRHHYVLYLNRFFSFLIIILTVWFVALGNDQIEWLHIHEHHFLSLFLFFVRLSNKANICIFLFSLSQDLWKKEKLRHHPDQPPLRLDPDLPLLKLDLAQLQQKLALVQPLPNQVNYINDQCLNLSLIYT
jgi:hypothetical protein